jgi:NitT/TauT family transport system substrate-binding protein
MSPFRRLATTVAALAAASLVLAACGGGQDEASDGDTRTVRVGAIPVVDVAALYVGQEQGYFADRGLELDIQMGQGGAALVPAVLQGDLDVAYAGVTSLFQARDRGLPVVAIAQGGASTGVQGKDHGGIVVAADSPIRDAADLEGRTVAVNALQGLHELAVRAAVKKAGGDQSKITFVELPLPDHAAALEKGRVEAVSTSEPFLSLVQSQGARVVASPFVDTNEDFVTAMYFTTEQTLGAKKDVVDDFRAALEESMTYAAKNPDAVRAVLPQFTELSQEQIDAMVLTRFATGLDPAVIEPVADLAVEFGMVEKPIDVDALLAGATR